MVIDTSALLAILFAEPELTAFSEAIYKSKNRYMSAVSFLEASVVAIARWGRPGVRHLDALVKALGIDLISFDDTQAKLARKASLTFGKGRHKAKLNFGDCCSYALAANLGDSLLFKGDDFAKTNVKKALR